MGVSASQNCCSLPWIGASSCMPAIPIPVQCTFGSSVPLTSLTELGQSAEEHGGSFAPAVETNFNFFGRPVPSRAFRTRVRRQPHTADHRTTPVPFTRLPVIVSRAKPATGSDPPSFAHPDLPFPCSCFVSFCLVLFHVGRTTGSLARSAVGRSIRRWRLRFDSALISLSDRSSNHGVSRWLSNPASNAGVWYFR
ncbi:hypothetical protein VTI74DRAFT_11317 [Chaetomium olivicolor]